MEYPNARDYTMVYITHKGFEEWSGTKRQYDDLPSDVVDEWKGYAVEIIRDDFNLKVAWDLATAFAKINNLNKSRVTDIWAPIK